MLTLNNIVKDYTAGDSTVSALKGITVHFRKSEFVSVLGQSGCGKTTLLNIIGGLDRYTSGDLIINGRSTKDYSDSDWDNYRNHSVGFVFQSYNLIPHQSVLSNVELALTLSGVSREERRRRATDALIKVGLGDQLHKKPNQMSGGQMQRVAIARALVNDPDILLADEPTGALDSETSVQIMEILKEISADKLIIMVTHNPELAEKYSTRIIRLLDGRITGDSMPYDPADDAPKGEAKPSDEKKRRDKKKKKERKPSMSLLTAASLSLNNLLTKKTRTFLTSFAGSIGIIGIALILSISTGVNAYISSVQEDVLSSYPISIQSESVDASTLMSTLLKADNDEIDHDLDKVYVNAVMYELMNALNGMEVNHNNLYDFKAFLDNEMAQNGTTELAQYATSVQYGYDLNLNILVKDVNGDIAKADVMALMSEIYGKEMMDSYGSYMAQSFKNFEIWDELLTGNDGEQVADLLKKQYDVIYGSWPQKYDEVVLIVDENNEISDLCMYALGLKTADQIKSEIEASMSGEQVEAYEGSWSYEDICGMTFRIVPNSDMYTENTAGEGYISLDGTETGLKYLYDNGTEIKITGIIRPSKDASAAMLKGSIGYTKALTEYVVNKANNSSLVKQQMDDPETDILTGLKFKPKAELSDAEKAEKVKEYASSLGTAEKAELYKTIISRADEEYLNETAATYLAAMSREEKLAALKQAFISQSGLSEQQAESYIGGLDDATVDEYMTEAVKMQISQQYSEQVTATLTGITDAQAAYALDSELDGYSEEKLADIYDDVLAQTYSESDYDSNLKLLGYTDFDRPSTINIYADTFEDKDKIAQIIADYNKGKEQKDMISYTDYVEMFMSAITVVINAISYVLMAFVSISLVVSSLMIGIITYISVLERTKEIGVLRSIGASKRDISRVFNAETLIIGFTSGAIGIIFTVLLCLPINAVIHHLTGISAINATLPAAGGVVLVIISMLLTFIAGLIPARIAANKDPVVALRSE